MNRNPNRQRERADRVRGKGENGEIKIKTDKRGIPHWRIVRGVCERYKEDIKRENKTRGYNIGVREEDIHLRL